MASDRLDDQGEVDLGTSTSPGRRSQPLCITENTQRLVEPEITSLEAVGTHPWMRLWDVAVMRLTNEMQTLYRQLEDQERALQRWGLAGVSPAEFMDWARERDVTTVGYPFIDSYEETIQSSEQPPEEGGFEAHNRQQG